LKRFFGTAALEQRDPEIVVRQRKAILERDRPPKARGRLRGTPKIAQHAAQVIMGLSVTAIEFERATMPCGGIVEPATRAQGIAEIGLRLWVIRQQPRCRFLRRKVIFALPIEGCREELP